MESRPWGFNVKLLPQHLHGHTKESNAMLQHMLVVAKLACQEAADWIVRSG
jgi:hypothetical protein